MKPFDLVAALEGAPVVLRNGCKAYVLADIANLGEFETIYCDEYPLVVIVAGGGLNMHMRDGSYYNDEPDNYKDIIGMWSDPPKTIRIGEYDVPEPVREPLEDDKEYWGVDPTAKELAWKYTWNNALFCNLMFRRGLIHLTKEAAVIHAKALLSLNKAAD